MKIASARLELILQSPTEVLAWAESLPAEVKAELSEDWLIRLRNANHPDPWACLFDVRYEADDCVVGKCGFKGPPNEHGVVEIAYGIDEPYQGQGFATEAAGALVNFAFGCEDVLVVRAHAKAENAASERVLKKSGFTFIGEVIEPDDGLVNRWEARRAVTATE